MDITELRAQAARTGDQLALLAAHPPELGGGYLAGVRDVARWLSDGSVSPALGQLLAEAERQAGG